MNFNFGTPQPKSHQNNQFNQSQQTFQQSQLDSTQTPNQPQFEFSWYQHPITPAAMRSPVVRDPTTPLTIPFMNEYQQNNNNNNMNTMDDNDTNYYHDSNSNDINDLHDQTSPAYIGAILGSYNAKLEHLQLNRAVLNDWIVELENDLIQQKEQSLAADIKNQQFMQQNGIQMNSNGQFNQQYHQNQHIEHNFGTNQIFNLSANTIMNNEQYGVKQQGREAILMKILQDRVQQSQLQREYLIDIQTQLEELKRQNLKLVEMSKIEEGKMKQFQLQQQMKLQQGVGTTLNNSNTTTNNTTTNTTTTTQPQPFTFNMNATTQPTTQFPSTTPTPTFPTPSATPPPSQPPQTTTQIPKPTNTTTTSTPSSLSRGSPTQRLKAQMDTFGLDEKIVHYYLYIYVFFHLCKFHQSTTASFQPTQTTSTEDTDALFMLYAMWSFQACHARDFPILIYNQLNYDFERKTGIYNPDKADEYNAMNWNDKLRITQHYALPLKYVNNLYLTLKSNFQFLAEFDQNSTHGQFIKPLMNQTILNFILQMKSKINPNDILSTLASISTPPTAKLSKTYESIGQTISRFGGIIAGQYLQQSGATKLTVPYHPIYTILTILRSYHELTESISDVYLLGMILAYLSQITPIWHYLHIGSVLHTHQHFRKTTTIDPITIQPGQLSTQPIYFIEKRKTCTLPSCICMFSTPKKIDNSLTDEGEVMTLRVSLIASYLQSITPKNTGLQLNDNLFTTSLPRPRRGLPDPQTTKQQLTMVLDHTHFDFSSFTFYITQLMLKLKNNILSSPYYPLLIASTWERCSCCGYNCLTNISTPSSTTATTNNNNNNDPHWSHSQLINIPMMIELISKSKSSSTTNNTTTNNNNNIFCYPTLYPFSAFANNNFTQMVQQSSPQFPTNLLPNNNNNSTTKLLKFGNNFRITFLWSYYAQVLNSPIQSSFIHVLLPLMKYSAFQLRLTYGNIIGHNLIEYIYNTILLQRKNELLQPPPTKSNQQQQLYGLNDVEYKLLLSDFDHYHNGGELHDDNDNVITITQPNGAFPYKHGDKFIPWSQSSSTAHEDISIEDRRGE